MGCGTLDWADLFDHVSELLSEEEDAPVRDHLASCDACRADSGELMVLSEGFWALGILTHVTGREAFADRARSETREAMGDKTAVRSTGAWRAMSAAESQRVRRAQLRRKDAIKNGVLVSTATVAVLALGVIVLLHFGAVAYLVDIFGADIEKSLSVDLAEFGLRSAPDEVAELARGAKDKDGVRALAEPIRRLLRRELSSSCRAQALVRLEFAHTLALKETAAARDLIATAVLSAAQAAEPAKPATPELIGVLKKVRGRWLAGDVEAVQELLIVPLTAGEPLAAYYSGLAVADSDGWEKGSQQLGRAAGQIPAVWPEVAWRWFSDGKPERARLVLDFAPQDDVKAALEALLAAKAR